jgi:hypothetical protein
MYGGVEVQLHSFLTSTVDGGEWSASRSFRFISEGYNVWHPQAAQAGCIFLRRDKSLFPLLEFEPHTVQFVA